MNEYETNLNYDRGDWSECPDGFPGTDLYCPFYERASLEYKLKN